MELEGGSAVEPDPCCDRESQDSDLDGLTATESRLGLLLLLLLFLLRSHAGLEQLDTFA
jgi:hypothetical protein